MKKLLSAIALLSLLSLACSSKEASRTMLDGPYTPNAAAEAVFAQIQKNEISMSVFDSTLTADEFEGILLSTQTCDLYPDKKIPLLGECPPLAQLLEPTDPPRVFQVTQEQLSNISKRLIHHTDERVRATAITYLLSDATIPTKDIVSYLMTHETSPVVHFTALRYMLVAAENTAASRYQSGDMKPYLTSLESNAHPFIRAIAAERDLTARSIADATPNTTQGIESIIREPGYVTDKESEALILLLARCTIDDAIQLDHELCYAYQVMEKMPADSERILPEEQAPKFERLMSDPAPLVRAFTMSSYAITALTAQRPVAVPLTRIMERLKTETSPKAILYTMTALEMFKEEPGIKETFESFKTHPNYLVSRTASIMYETPKPTLSPEEIEKLLTALSTCTPDKDLNIPEDCEAMREFKTQNNRISPEVGLPIYKKYTSSDNETVRAIAYYAAISAQATLDLQDGLADLVRRGFEDSSLFVQKMVVFTSVLYDKVFPNPAFSEIIKKALSHEDMRIRFIVRDARDAYLHTLSQTE